MNSGLLTEKTMSKFFLHSGEDLAKSAERFFAAWEMAVREDVAALIEVGLIDRKDGKISADYDEIGTAIVM